MVNLSFKFVNDLLVEAITSLAESNNLLVEREKRKVLFFSTSVCF